MSRLKQKTLALVSASLAPLDSTIFLKASQSQCQFTLGRIQEQKPCFTVSYHWTYQSLSWSLFLAGITGFAEPLGALIGYLVFSLRNADISSADSKITYGVLFGITAGIMTQVAIKALLLEASRYDPTDRIVSTVSLKFWQWFLLILLNFCLFLADFYLFIRKSYFLPRPGY